MTRFFRTAHVTPLIFTAVFALNFNVAARADAISSTRNAPISAFSLQTQSRAQVGTASPNFAKSPTIQRVVLANGLTLLTQTDRLSPRVAISVLVRAGAANETPQNAGWRRLLVETMLRTTQNTARNGTISVTQRNAQAEELGGRIGASVSDDAIEFWVTGESQNANALLELLLQTVRAPRLADDDVKAARKALNARRDLVAGDVTTMATGALATKLFADADGEPLAYALPPLGTKASLDAISSTRLRALWQQFFVSKQTIVGATGDLDEINLKSRLTALSFGANTNVKVAKNPVFADVKSGEPTVISHATIVPGDWVFVAYKLGAIEEIGDDAPALGVLAAALGTSPKSHLSRRFLTLSETPSGKANGVGTLQVLAQQASAAFTSRRFGSDLTVFALTGVVTSAQLQKEIEIEIKRLRDAPLSSAELQNARQYAIGDWALGGEILHDRAFRLASDEMIGWHGGNSPERISSTQFADSDWISRLQSVTAADVQRVAQRYLKNEAVVVVRAAD